MVESGVYNIYTVHGVGGVGVMHIFLYLLIDPGETAYLLLDSYILLV